MIDTVVYSLLKSISLVQENIGTRIYPSVVPEKCHQSAIRYVVGDLAGEITTDGPDAYERATLQVDVYHGKYTKCRQTSRAIKKSLHGYQSIHSGIDIDLIEFIDTDMLYEKKTREHRALMTFTIKYKES